MRSVCEASVSPDSNCKRILPGQPDLCRLLRELASTTTSVKIVRLRRIKLQQSHLGPQFCTHSDKHREQKLHNLWALPSPVSSHGNLVPTVSAAGSVRVQKDRSIMLHFICANHFRNGVKSLHGSDGTILLNCNDNEWNKA